MLYSWRFRAHVMSHVCADVAVRPVGRVRAVPVAMLLPAHYCAMIRAHAPSPRHLIWIRSGWMAATFRLTMVTDTNSIEDRNGLAPRQLRHRDGSRGLPRPTMLSLSMSVVLLRQVSARARDLIARRLHSISATRAKAESTTRFYSLLDSCAERDVTFATWWRGECRSAC
jgi:hypothetical protein